MSTNLKTMIDFYRRHQWHDCKEEMPPKDDVVEISPGAYTPVSLGFYDGRQWSDLWFRSEVEDGVRWWRHVPNPPEVSP